MTPLTSLRRGQCHVAVLIGVMGFLATLVGAIFPQTDFPACPINHSPVYYCCEYGQEKEVYTRFQRPSGGAYDQDFVDGWRRARQVNFPDAFYAPDAPWFHYHNPDEVCRLQRLVRSDGTLHETLACGPATTITNPHDGLVGTNASLPEDSQDASVYWTSRKSPRNSNTSFPIGATCLSLMLPSGKVDADAKRKCLPAPPPVTFRFSTYVETPLVVVYVLYGLFAVVLVLWFLTRASLLAMSRGGSGGPEQSATTGPVKASKEGITRFVDEQNGLVTPMLTRRNTEVELRAAADSIEQTGYQDSRIGQAIYGYYVLLTIGLFPIMLIVIFDSNGHFQPSLFDPVNVLIVVYMLIWAITSVWLIILVVFHTRLANFFRVRAPLHRCQYVNMFNPEASEILLADRSGVSQLIARIENALFPRSKSGYEETLLVRTSEDGHRFVEFQHLRYIYDELYGKFLPGSVPFPETFAQVHELRDGLTSSEVARRRAIVGANAIVVPMPTTTESVVKEVFRFFYIYELMCYYVWFFTGYYKVAVVNTIIIVGVITFNIIAQRRLFHNVLKMTRVQGGVGVQRDGVWQTIPVVQLVPGDLVRVVENWELPCDLVVIKGMVLCDESSLTGESMPVQKFPVPTRSHDVYDPEDQRGKKHTLFAGGKTLASGQSRTEQNTEVLAIVTSTGAHTVRGQLIQSILYPSLVRFKYEEHLKACVLFLLCYGLIAAYVAMRFLMDNAGLSNTLFAFVFGMFMLSAVLSPLIPVVITVGQVNATRRLQRRGIFCLNPQRVALSGKVRVFAFDKTGTLTKEGLDFRGCLPVASTHRGSPIAAFQREFEDPMNPELNLIMKFALATCHAVGYLDEELVGNEVEVKMLQATKWRLIEETFLDPHGHEHIRSIIESPDGEHTLEILKRFEFDHVRVCMSVIVEDLKTHRRFVFCKGSYEKMHELCLLQTIPADYSLRAERLAREGCYVLGIGYKELPTAAEFQQLVPAGSAMAAASTSRAGSFAADRLSRDEVETNLSLLGLIMFQNELKEDSAEVLATLKEGDIRTVMITGDNAMTGCYIARQSGMVRPGARVVLGEILATNQQGAKALVWKDVDTQEILSNREILDMAERSGVGAFLGGHVGQHEQWELALTGPAFNYLRKMGDLPKILFLVRIFSRMTPVEKADCIAEMMSAGAVTGMCGDGGNDCGALRMAHVGVALSDTEASVVSPFTSQKKSIAAVLDVCREGRCSLATSFGNLKFLMAYGMIGCGVRFTMYANSVFMSQYAFMFDDGLILVGMSYAISLARPLRNLGKERPTSSLVGPATIMSLLGQVLIHVLFLYGAVSSLMSQPWYCPFSPEDIDLTKWWLLQDTHLSSTLFLVSTGQYLSTAFSYGFGSRFHEPVWRNYVLVAYSIALVAFVFYLAIGAPGALSEHFRMTSSTNVIGLPDIPTPDAFRWKLVLLVGLNMLTILIYEKLFILGPVKRWLRSRLHRDGLQLRL